MSKRSKDSLVFKLVILLSLVRWYNILLTACAQYIAAFFIFNKWFNRWDILFDYKLHSIVLCTAIFIAAGYIINFFYDKEIDLINYPKRTQLYLVLSKDFLIKTYFGLLGLGLIIAFIASIKIGVFFFVFSFLLWFYSHKLKRIPYVRELSATLLTIASFFSITVHYSKISPGMFLYGWFIFFIILIREGIKDKEHAAGNAVFSYYTVSIINNPSQFLTLLKGLGWSALIPVVCFLFYRGLTHPTLWFMAGIWGLLMIALYGLDETLKKKQIIFSNRLLKVSIILSLFGLVWL